MVHSVDYSQSVCGSEEQSLIELSDEKKKKADWLTDKDSDQMIKYNAKVNTRV